MADFSIVEFQVWRLLENGRRDEAEDLIIAKFRAGYSSKPLLQLVANLLALKGKAWPRRSGYPREWMEIGMRDRRLRWERAMYRAKSRSEKRRCRDENKPKPRIDQLMHDFKRKDPKTIKKALKVYRAILREAEEAEREAK
jgi:hypothetical protein